MLSRSGCCRTIARNQFSRPRSRRYRTGEIDGTLAKSYGSQGQQRTLVLALKLAELELIEQIVGEPPLLLLDDVLAELDLHRQNQLLNAIADRFQTIVTTTHLGLFDREWLNSSQILHVSNGKIERPSDR